VSTPAPHATLAPAPGVRTARCADEVVLLDAAGTRLHVLDAPAALVWSCFDGETSTDDIVHDIVEVFQRDVDDVRSYVGTLVALLVSRELLVEAFARSVPVAHA
jgi:hypothetical protein